jgi:hypothetical protein
MAIAFSTIIEKAIFNGKENKFGKQERRSHFWLEIRISDRLFHAQPNSYSPFSNFAKTEIIPLKLNKTAITSLHNQTASALPKPNKKPIAILKLLKARTWRPSP